MSSWRKHRSEHGLFQKDLDTCHYCMDEAKAAKGTKKFLFRTEPLSLRKKKDADENLLDSNVLDPKTLTEE